MGHSQDVQEEPPQPLSCFPGICSPSRCSLIPRRSVPLKEKHVSQKQQAFYRNHWNCGVPYAQGQMGWSYDPLDLEVYDSMVVCQRQIQQPTDLEKDNFDQSHFRQISVINWHWKDSPLQADTSNEKRQVLAGNRKILSRLKTWEKHQLQTDFLQLFKICFGNSCLQSCGNIPEGNPVPWHTDCFDHIDYKSRYRRSEWQKLSISLLNVEPNLLTKTLATCVSEIVPAFTEKSQTTLMKCKFAAVNTHNHFPLVHQDQLAVRSAFLGFAEKPVGVGGDS